MSAKLSSLVNLFSTGHPLTRSIKRPTSIPSSWMMAAPVAMKPARVTGTLRLSAGHFAASYLLLHKHQGCASARRGQGKQPRDKTQASAAGVHFHTSTSPGSAHHATCRPLPSAC